MIFAPSPQTCLYRMHWKYLQHLQIRQDISLHQIRLTGPFSFESCKLMGSSSSPGFQTNISQAYLDMTESELGTFCMNSRCSTTVLQLLPLCCGLGNKMATTKPAGCLKKVYTHLNELKFTGCSVWDNWIHRYQICRYGACLYCIQCTQKHLKIQGPVNVEFGIIFCVWITI